jgi:phenylacetate-coenzyme A ligase PaaK-like adenylate-forming protein
MSPPGLISFLRTLPAGLRLGAAELQAVRLLRLRRLIEHAYEAVPYYRRLFDSVGFQPGHLRQLSDLSAIPITRRENLQIVPRSELIAKGVNISRLRASHTSGSTGTSLQVYRTRRESQLRRLLTFRAFLHDGLRWNDRVITISRSATTPPNIGGIRCRPYLQRWNMSFFEKPEKQLQWVLKIRPTILYGNPASVAILGDLILNRDMGPMPLRLVATSVETLTPGYRAAIQKAFAVEPVEIYNCSELGDIGWQCERRAGFHVNADWLHVEVMRQDQAVAPGEIGEVVVTSLYRYTMPLIRYSPGDFASPAETACPCGLGLPLLGSLEGRVQSMVALPNGGYFIGFSGIINQFSEISRFQVMQKALDHFLVNVIPGAGFSGEVLSSVSAALSARLGAGIRVETRAVTASELIQGPGKFRPVIPIAPIDFNRRV